MRLMFRAAVAIMAVLFAAPAAHAQASFSIAAGASVPVGSTADGVNTGYNVTAGLNIKPPLAPIGLRVEGLLNSMDFKNSSFGSMRMIGGLANLTLSGAALPMGYLIGGAGMYNVAFPDIPAAKSETKFGFNVGAGLSFPLTGFSTFLEARLHVVSTAGSSTKFIPITFGIKF